MGKGVSLWDIEKMNYNSMYFRFGIWIIAKTVVFRYAVRFCRALEKQPLIPIMYKAVI